MTEPIDPQYPENAQPPAQHAPSLPPLTEDQALARLKQRNLPIEAVEEIVRNAGLMKSRKVRILLAAHPCAPRRVALRLIREFYTFDLMQFALRPGTPADLRRFADEVLISRVASITLGECISLARRSSEMVAGALLLHRETAVWQAALQNPRLTEKAIIRALSRTAATPSSFCLSVYSHRPSSVFDPYYKRSKSSRHAKISSMEIITPLRKMF